MNGSSEKTITIALVAGEASGDTLGAHLIEALKAKLTARNLEFIGIGGAKMQRAGLTSLYPQEALAVRGYVEVFKSLPRIFSIRRGLLRKLSEIKPDIFIGIDAPDFNLGLARVLKARGIRTMQYVSPSIWAWRGERIHKIKASVHHILTLFPMEAPLYEAVGLPVTFVGHPLAQRFADDPSQAAAKKLLQLHQHIPQVFTCLVGSRLSELDYMAELFIDTAYKIHETYPEAVFLFPLATRPTHERMRKLFRIREIAYDERFRLLYGHAQEAIEAADGVLVTSGTASLEVALAKRPMVISYRVSSWTYHLVRRRLKIPYIGLPNILRERFVVPEILQDDATPENLALMLLNQYHDVPYQNFLKQEFLQLHQSLKVDTATLAAQAVLSEIRVNG